MVARPMVARAKVAGPGLILALLLALAGCAAPRAELVLPDGTQRATNAVQAAAGARVVLLGEQHDSAADHQWQLAVVKQLYAADPAMILAFEMFPRGAQKVLNAWVAGRLSEAAFLQQTDWAHVWGFDAALYMPIFRFARDHHIPMLALNVSHHLVHLVAQRGWQAVAVQDREGVGTPAPAGAAYSATLIAAMGEHGAAMPPSRRAHFIDAQLLWDRAMAEAIAVQDGRRVVALMGKGHLQGVPRQLGVLGVSGVVALQR